MVLLFRIGRLVAHCWVILGSWSTVVNNVLDILVKIGEGKVTHDSLILSIIRNEWRSIFIKAISGLSLSFLALLILHQEWYKGVEGIIFVVIRALSLGVLVGNWVVFVNTLRLSHELVGDWFHYSRFWLFNWADGILRVSERVLAESKECLSLLRRASNLIFLFELLFGDIIGGKDLLKFINKLFRFSTFTHFHRRFGSKRLLLAICGVLRKLKRQNLKQTVRVIMFGRLLVLEHLFEVREILPILNAGIITYVKWVQTRRFIQKVIGISLQDVKDAALLGVLYLFLCRISRSQSTRKRR